MNRALKLLRAIDGAIHYLRVSNKGIRRHASASLREGERLRVARDLRRWVVASITELDADVLEDLIRMIKKVGKDAAKGNNNNGYSERLKLALELTQMTLNNRKTPVYPKPLLDDFNQIYNSLWYVIQEEGKQKLTTQGGA